MAPSGRRRAGVILVAAVVGVAVTARLGAWQLDRAAQKTAIQTQIDARRDLPPLDGPHLARAREGAAQQHYRRVVLRGRWLAEHTVFLDNRQMNGAVGFYVVTPLQLDGEPEAVLVQRGWVPRNFRDRTALPALRTPAGVTLIEGLVAPPPSRLYEFSAEASGPIRQNLDLDAFARETRLALLPLSVLQSDAPASAGDGLMRRWTLPALDVQMHYGYAFQWFALCALIAGLYVWFQLIQPLRRGA
jgi:surfeit locus 1 family protein